MHQEKSLAGSIWLNACTASCTSSLWWPTAARWKRAHLMTRLQPKKRNAENSLVIQDEPGIARQYQAEFNRLWNESVPVICPRTE